MFPGSSPTCLCSVGDEMTHHLLNVYILHCWQTQIIITPFLLTLFPFILWPKQFGIWCLEILQEITTFSVRQYEPWTNSLGKRNISAIINVIVRLQHLLVLAKMFWSSLSGRNVAHRTPSSAVFSSLSHFSASTFFATEKKKWAIETGTDKQHSLAFKIPIPLSHTTRIRRSVCRKCAHTSLRHLSMAFFYPIRFPETSPLFVLSREVQQPLYCLVRVVLPAQK